MKSREIVVAILVATGVVLVGMIFLGLLWGFGGMGSWGMMGGQGMMGGAGIFWWLLFCLSPLLLGALVIAGAIWLLNNRADTPKDVPAVLESCPNCRLPVQKNWNICPNCGQSLRNG